ncbi:MAG TPA: helix-turn-helix domain-containing protein [Thermomicrobiales bacterium]|nr:helix-turn-helix domain-containing protein [Thermomicrobiales bacterium]
MLNSVSDTPSSGHVALSAGQFENVAETITKRTATLLHADVTVTNARGIVVASSVQDIVGLQYGSASDGGDATFLRFPIRLDSHQGEVIVARPASQNGLPLEAAQTLIDLLADQAAIGTRLPNQYELKNKFIHDLVMGAFSDTVDLRREGQILGMDLSAPRAVVLVDASEYVLRAAGGRPAGEPSVEHEGSSIRRRAQHVIASVVSFFNLPDDTICGYIGNGEIAVLKASADRDLSDWMSDDDRSRPTASLANLNALKRAGAALLTCIRHDTRLPVNVGIGRYHAGIRGLSHSYQDASLAVQLGKRLHGDDRVHCLDSLGVAAFVGVSDPRTKLDLAEHLLRPLDGEPELLRTLQSFFDEDCCPSSTAARLEIHRNTLAYRLERIATLLNLNPRQFDDAVQLRIALLVRTFQHN